MDTELKIEEFVSVSLRIRPALSQDSTESSCLQVISKQPPVLLVLDRLQTYHFDNIFTEDVDQEKVYTESVKPLVEYVKQGYSSTVFAYGQTGTGKTYTMGTSIQAKKKEAGLISRALEEFFDYSENDIETEISVSYIEIYNEKVFDLLQNNKPPLTVKGFQVQGLCQEKVFNSYDAKHFLKMGNRNRHTAETKQNCNSSRSHAIFTIHCNVRHKQHETSAKLNLVDLAGCESVRKTGNQGSTFQEGVNINKGLLCIGQVMTALSANTSFIPYRQSIITTILQDSLNRKNLVSLIACVNANPEDCNETIQTLEFARRVKKMKNKPEINEVLTQYKRDHPALFQPIRMSSTPFKRPAPLLHTPHPAKRVKPLALKTINEPSGNSTAVDSPKSLASISVSSIISNVDPAQQTLSPMIRKYVTALESSIMDRIETVIKNTLKRPTRSSLLAKEQISGGNTPSMRWSKIQNEVTRMVRTEIAQMTSKATRAASSPLDEHPDCDKIRRVLKYDSPLLNESIGKENEHNDKDESKNSFTGETVFKSIGQKYDSPLLNESNEKENEHNDGDESTNSFTGETVFKVPELPFSKKKPVESKQDTSLISPIEFVPRRSTRLSTKRINNNAVDSINSSCICLNHSSFYESRYKKRCSVRLAKKRNELEKQNTENESILNNCVDQIQQSAVKAKNDVKRARSRLGNKGEPSSKNFTSIDVKATPAGKRVARDKTSGDSPATAHSKHVLMLLNDGNDKQLEKLHSIGPKTAQQILLFREMKGPLKRISDLSLMPGWHGKKFKMFVEQNFIKDELL